MKTPEPIAPSAGEDDEDAISQRAAEMFAQRRWGPWCETDQAALDAWLADSVLHEVAWLRVKAIADRADRLAARNTTGPKGAARGENISFRRWLLPSLIAASLALMLPFAISYVAGLMVPAERAYSTEVGGRTTLKFADGSIFDLNTNTSVRVQMTSAERLVWLDKGEVWFHVSHDAAHPFAVVVGRNRITDLGTEFVVRRKADGLDVALLKGKAALSSEGAPAAMLAPGDDAVVTAASLSVTRLPPQALADKLAWRNGMLVFRNERLADVVRELNRYTSVKLVIADSSIEDLKVNGEIRDDNLNDFLETAETMMNVRADRRGNEILLSRIQTEKTRKARHAKREL